MKDNCQCRGIQGQPKNFGRQFLADAPGIIKQTLMSEVRKGTCSDKGLSKEIIACGWLSKCLEGLLQKRLQNLKPSQVWLKMPQFTCAESCANERKRRNFFISIKSGRTEMWWLHRVLRFIKKFQTYYEHFSITISSELLMSETLVSDVFLGIFVHERES